MYFLFVCNSILLGAALAMDAFSVSLANGLEDPGMRGRRVCGIAGVFALFQIAMPLIGWVCIHTIAEYFDTFRAWIPWIALALLAFLGGKMLVEGIRDLRKTKKERAAQSAVGTASKDDAPANDAPANDAPATRGGATPAAGTGGTGLTLAALLLQGIATSIDALSVGFTIAEDPFWLASISAGIIGAVTFLLCFLGVHIGKRFGTRLAGRATVTGGLILIGIGIEIFVKGVFFS